MDARLPTNNSPASAGIQSLIGHTVEEIDAAATLLRFSRVELISASTLRAGSVHGDNCYYCPRCPRVFHKEETLRQHLFDIHQCEVAPMPFDCPICGFSFIFKESQNLHKANLHDQNYFCRYCPTAASNPRTLEVHLHQHHPRETALDNRRNAMEYGCRQCGMLFFHEEEASAHFPNQCRTVVVGQEGIPRCALCLKEFRERETN